MRQLLRANELAILQSTALEYDYLSATSLRARIQVLARFDIQSLPELLMVLHNYDSSLEDPADFIGRLLPRRLLVQEQRLSKLSPLMSEAAFQEGDSLTLEVLRMTTNTPADQIENLTLPSSTLPSTDLGVLANIQFTRKHSCEL